MASSEDPQRSSAGSGTGTGRVGSGRSSRGQNPAQQLSTIEKSVTHLLVATKQLLETLTLWSRQSASESEVSDVYVRLGYEFNIACRAFNSIGVETSDLGPVPDLLRGILEDTLSQEASQQALDKYLPRIRDIIIGLLHGLKKKQQRLRQKGSGATGGTGTSGSAAIGSTANGLGDAKATRQNSTASNLSVESSLTQQLEDGMAAQQPSRHSSSRSFAQRQGSGDLGSAPDFLPPRSSSTATGTGEKRISPQRRQLSPHNSVHATSSRETMGTEFGSSTQSQHHQSAMQMQIPTIAPYPETDTIPTNPLPYTNQTYQPQQPPLNQQNLYPPSGAPSPDEGPPPRPPPKGTQNDALTALQRGGDLERRASRRFSAYQIQKHLGGTGMMGMGAIPAAQHSPIPNRGRDVRESMSAVRARGTVRGDGRTRSRVEKPAGSPGAGYGTANDVLSRRISEADEGAAELDAQPTPPPVRGGFGGEGDDGFGVDSPIVKTPEDKLGAYPFPVEGQREMGNSSGSGGGVGATLNGPMEDVVMLDENSFTPVEPPKRGELDSAPQVNGVFHPHQQQHAAPSLSRATSRAIRYDTPPPAQYNTPASNEGSPQPGKELTLFLQYKSRIKKYVLDGGELSVPRLQLAFIEKFAWNTQENGGDLPEIYIQDPVSGVRYELDGLQDVRDRSVLVLNVEALDEVKRHIDDGIGGLRRMVEGLRVGMEEQKGALGLVSERQQEAAKTLAGVVVAAAPVVVGGGGGVARSASGHMRSVSTKQAGGQLEEVRSLRRDLAVVRQTYGAFVADINASMASIKTKAVGVKKAAAATVAAVPALDVGGTGNNNAGRAHVDKGKKSLSEDSEKIVNRVDDLQDVVEDLRKDVVLRGVRPLPRQLETVSKDISLATSELKKLQEYLRKEKPVWTKIWERELQVVCDERELLTMQEELVMDLEDDLEKAAVTFALVEEATRQQNLVANPGEAARVASGGGMLTPGGSRSSSRTLRSVGVADPTKAHDGVLGEVRALQPNHESRLEAIERAEKMRQRELEDRKGGEFQRELGSFVEDGRLKKSGGVEEVERLRKAREEKTRREVWETTQARERARAEKEAAKSAPPAVEMPAAATNGVPEVPTVENYEGTRESSPELFVEAKEDVGS
ncbi:Bud site selection protein 6 [Elasticomyces elasticus]|nr:Bud site selection protein 6 [Elasticomyces elasticus]KAK3655820.1 Bud site selection protein 6 [Elasticomyces elasticus]KAK4925840.1 Bud site selection protein 6 [Elasticomyces elasticus]KAK5764794.1 Bud site selection protein 6 [Elasticomyces elasticus]